MEQESTLTAKGAKSAKEDSYRGSARMHADLQEQTHTADYADHIDFR